MESSPRSVLLEGRRGTAAAAWDACSRPMASTSSGEFCVSPVRASRIESGFKFARTFDAPASDQRGWATRSTIGSSTLDRTKTRGGGILSAGGADDELSTQVEAYLFTS